MTTHAVENTATKTSEVTFSVWQTLKFTFAIVPIIAGADKFTNLLTDWAKYLTPPVTNLIPFDPHTFMLIVGVIEITAGIIVFVKTEIGAYIVSAWLVCIALTLIIGGAYLDVAVRDLVMAISALSLARLSKNAASRSI